MVDPERFYRPGVLVYVRFLCLPLCPERVLLEAAWSVKTRGVYTPSRGAQTVQTPYSAAFAVLGCVPMGENI